MRAKLLGTVAGAMLASLLWASAVPAQAPAQPPAPDQAAAPLAPAQFDQMLAPVALYPDDLLGQILMAAGYPLEIVDADRWLQDPANAALRGDDLASALDQQSWDPSVKSLAAFPQVLHMMDGQLDWTESLGEAFIDDPSSVMDSVQRLRRQAEAAGKLRSNVQEVVTNQDGEITIAPADAQTVYVPDYEPSVVYGPWPYPDWPPYYFPDYFDSCAFDDFGYCWFAVPIILPLWGWDHWDWRDHRIDIDRDRFTRLDHGRPPIGGDVWRHDPTHRSGVPYQSPAARERFQGASSLDRVRGDRGYPAAGAGALSTEQRGSRITTLPSAPPAPRVPPSFESYGSGADARMQAQRGQASRMSAPSYQPRGGMGGFPRGGMPSSGGRGRR